MSTSESTRIGIVTISDRASSGQYQDRGGPAIQQYLTRVLASPWEPILRLIPDEKRTIEEVLIELCDSRRCSLVITTGGTGPAVRDVTPEATESVCQKMMPGFGERMRAVSVANVPTAILSRQMAGIRGQTLIVNLPGSPKAIAECMDAIFPAIPYCIELIGGPFITTNENQIATYRPR